MQKTAFNTLLVTQNSLLLALKARNLAILQVVIGDMCVKLGKWSMCDI